MGVSHPSLSSAEEDLESTAELPMLDLAACEAAAEADALAATDHWAQPPMLEPAVGPEALVATLRAVEEQLQHQVGRVAELEEERDRLRAQLDAASAGIRRLEQSLSERSLAAQALEARGAELAVEAERLRTEAQPLREALAERAALLEQREGALTAAQAAIAETAHRAAQAEAQRSALDRELALARERVAALERSEGELHAELDRRARTFEARESAFEGAQAELTELRRRNAAYLETLQSRLGRRDVYESACAAFEARIAGLEAELGARAERLAGLEAALGDREQRIAALEQDLGAESQARAGSEAEATRAGQERAQLAERGQFLETHLASRDSELAALTRELEAARAGAAHQDERLAELDRQRALAEERAAAQTRSSEAMAALLEHAEGHIKDQRLHAEALRLELQEKAARLHELEEQLRAVETNALQLEESRASLQQARQALEEREATIRRLESEAATHVATLGDLQQSIQRLEPLAQVAPEATAQGPTRLLIRCEGESEVVHVLGRRTTIGRTPDNDLQIDTKFISRHHAVVLAGPAQTIIEDLDSTNGVLVNDRRITRKALQDGDRVLIGKSLFRFVVRSGPGTS